MYQLASHVGNSFGELPTLLEAHITQQGLSDIEKLGDEALTVSLVIAKTIVFLRNEKDELNLFQLCDI